MIKFGCLSFNVMMMMMAMMIMMKKIMMVMVMYLPSSSCKDVGELSS